MIHIMHNFCETILKLNTIELTEEEKEYPQRTDELETKCLSKKLELVGLNC